MAEHRCTPSITAEGAGLRRIETKVLILGVVLLANCVCLGYLGVIVSDAVSFDVEGRSCLVPAKRLCCSCGLKIQNILGGGLGLSKKL